MSSKKGGKVHKGASDAGNTSTTTSNKPKQNLMVDHTYTDYAIITPEVDTQLLEEENPELPAPISEQEAEARRKLKGMSCTYGPMKKNAGGVTQPFPGKLMEVLSRTDLTEIVEWMPHGRAFLVKQPKTFASQVLPRYFKQSKYLSFTRQLNLWGFKRITRGQDMGAYYHEIFLRGRPHLAMRMKRQKIKGTGMKLTPNPDSEPDFYTEYPMMPPLDPSQQNLAPLPPLPAERMNILMQPAPADVSSQNLFKALKVASTQQHPKMQSSVLTHPHLQHMHQQHQFAAAAAASRMMPGANSDYHRLLGAMNASAGVNSMFSAETLHQLQQQHQSLHQQEQQLQQALEGTTGPAGLANAGGYQHLYGAMNHQSGINPMLAAASHLPPPQLPPILPSSMLSPGMLSSANLTSHMAARAYDDLLLAPGVRNQLGLSASGLPNANATAGTLGGGLSGSYGVKDQLSSVMRQYGGANPTGLVNTTAAPQVTAAELLQRAQSESLKSKTKDDAADAVATKTISEGDAAASAGVPPSATVGAAKKASKSASPPTEKDASFTGHGNDPLQDALQKVHKLDDDAASLQRAKAKILQSMSQSGVEPTDAEGEEKKNGTDNPPSLGRQTSVGRPFTTVNSDD